ncbi:hypothetical protein ACFWUU_01070 [Kribbella sp. NPDC058693]|uniref:hypothetical protein n=1 Tax=Kribbella sp. NPDC058693 TaxID=3346602 RepID=UPI00365E077B
MAGWEGLRVDLRRLLGEAPEALVVLPDPDSERRERPIRIDLAAWATDIAAELKAKYGDVVELRVGAMTFPAKQLWVNEYSRQCAEHPLSVRGSTYVLRLRCRFGPGGRRARTHW